MIQQFQFWQHIQKTPKTPPETDVCILTFTPALFTIAKTWKQPTCLLKDEWIKSVYTYTHNGILLSHKNQQDPTICDHMGGFWKHNARWNKSDRERQILYDLTNMWNLNTKQKAKLLDKEIGLVVPEPERRGRRNWRKMVKRYKLVRVINKYGLGM